jgi:MSHA biogenesis protein MshJ
MPASVKEQFKKWQELIDARVMRERALIFSCMLAAVFMLWNFVIQAPLDKKRLELESKIAASENEQRNLQTQIAAVTQSLLNDPSRTKKAQITQLESDIASVDSQLQSVSQRLIKAEQLPLALQDVLSKAERVTLLEVNTMPAMELQLTQLSESGQTSSQTSTKSQPGAQNAGVYMHAVELKLAGNYAEVLQLLKSLEQLPWRFYWQTLDYKVIQYPRAEILLRVYTLSSEEGLLGV